MSLSPLAKELHKSIFVGKETLYSTHSDKKSAQDFHEYNVLAFWHPIFSSFLYHNVQ